MWSKILLFMCVSTCSFGGVTNSTMPISVEVTCNCVVNGIIVPINNGACVPECHKLQNNNDTSSVNIEINGDTEIITY